MPIEIRMPALSPTMTEGKLAKWIKQEGDEIAAGDVLAEIETDKATMEVEAVEEGTLGRILVPEGAEGVAVNSVIALLLEEGEAASLLETYDAAPASEEKREGSAAPEARAQDTAPATVQRPEAAAPAAEPDWDGPTKKQTVREALRDAMAEELRRDERVFVMGEEVAEYEGAYKVTQ